MRPYRVYRIENGTVIDHITNGQALKVLHILDLGTDSEIAVGMNFESKKLGKKDIVKVENAFVADEVADKIALIAPRATVNNIRDGELVSKHAIRVPDCLSGALRCINPNCITNKECIVTRFVRVPDRPRLAYRCAYCERIMDEPDFADNLV